MVNFPDLSRNGFWNGRRNKLLANLSVPTVEAVGTNQNKTFLRLYIGFLDKRKKSTHLMFTRSENIYFNATKLVFV